MTSVERAKAKRTRAVRTAEPRLTAGELAALLREAAVEVNQCGDEILSAAKAIGELVPVTLRKFREVRAGLIWARQELLEARKVGPAHSPERDAAADMKSDGKP
jgi:hypothetical protein